MINKYQQTRWSFQDWHGVGNHLEQNDATKNMWELRFPGCQVRSSCHKIGVKIIPRLMSNNVAWICTYITHWPRIIKRYVTNIRKCVNTLAGFLWDTLGATQSMVTHTDRSMEKWSSLDRRRPPPFRSIIRFSSQGFREPSVFHNSWKRVHT